MAEKKPKKKEAGKREAGKKQGVAEEETARPMIAELPPDPLPPLPDPEFGGRPSPYSVSGLGRVCGPRISPDSRAVYTHRDLALNPGASKTAVHPQIEDWIRDVRSFDPHAHVIQPPASEWPLSVICPRIERLAFPLEPMTYIVDYGAFHSNPRTLPDPKKLENYRANYPEGSRLILSFFSDHTLAVGMWNLTEFWYQPWLKEFDAVIAPDFDSFSDSPRPQYLLGERMQQIFAEEGSEQGYVSIPSISWATEESLKRQIDLWTSRYPQVNTINLNCYGSHVNRTGWIWRWLFAIEKYCAPHKGIRWLISGITVGWAIAELNKILPEKNYMLMSNVSLFIAALRGSAQKELQAENFRRQIKLLEDFRSGQTIPDPVPRPESWPQFSELRR